MPYSNTIHLVDSKIDIVIRHILFGVVSVKETCILRLLSTFVLLRHIYIFQEIFKVDYTLRCHVYSNVHGHVYS